MARRERDILEYAVHTAAERAANPVDEALDVGLDGSHPLAVPRELPQ